MKKYVAEMIGTMVLVLMGCGSAVIAGAEIGFLGIAFAFGLSAEIERHLISQRTKEALAKRRKDGVTLGRPKGKISAPEKYKLNGKELLIEELLEQGMAKSKIARICGVTRNTLDRYLRNIMAALDGDEQEEGEGEV